MPDVADALKYKEFKFSTKFCEPIKNLNSRAGVVGPPSNSDAKIYKISFSNFVEDLKRNLPIITVISLALLSTYENLSWSLDGCIVDSDLMEINV